MAARRNASASSRWCAVVAPHDELALDEAGQRRADGPDPEPGGATDLVDRGGTQHERGDHPPPRVVGQQPDDAAGIRDRDVAHITKLRTPASLLVAAGVAPAAGAAAEVGVLGRHRPAAQRAARRRCRTGCDRGGTRGVSSGGKGSSSSSTVMVRRPMRVAKVGVRLHPQGMLDETRMRDEPCREESEEALAEGDTRFTPGTARAALRHAVFRRLFIGAFLSNIGSWMQQIVLGGLRLRPHRVVDVRRPAGLRPARTGARARPRRRASSPTSSTAKLLLVVTVAQMACARRPGRSSCHVDDPSRSPIFLAALGSGVANAVFMPAYCAMLPGLVGQGRPPRRHLASTRRR